MWSKNQNLSHTLSWKPFGTSAEQSHKAKTDEPSAWEFWPLRLRSQWELQAAGPLLPLSSSLCSQVWEPVSRASEYWQDLGHWATAGIQWKWAPDLPGTASTFQDLIFLVKGKSNLHGVLQWSKRETVNQFLSLPFSDWVALNASLTNQFLCFWSEREGPQIPKTLQL